MHRTEVEVHVVNKFLCQLFFWKKNKCPYSSNYCPLFNFLWYFVISKAQGPAIATAHYWKLYSSHLVLHYYTFTNVRILVSIIFPNVISSVLCLVDNYLYYFYVAR